MSTGNEGRLPEVRADSRKCPPGTKGVYELEVRTLELTLAQRHA